MCSAACNTVQVPARSMAEVEGHGERWTFLNSISAKGCSIIGPRKSGFSPPADRPSPFPIRRS